MVHTPSYAARETSQGTRKVTRKAPRGSCREVTCKARASPRKVTCILARRRAKNACIATYSSCGSMRDCVEVSLVSRVASDAAWNRSCCAERRWGVEFAFSSWCGAAGRRGAAQRRRRLGIDFARNIFMVHARARGAASDAHGGQMERSRVYQVLGVVRDLVCFGVGHLPGKDAR